MMCAHVHSQADEDENGELDEEELAVLLRQLFAKVIY